VNETQKPIIMACSCEGTMPLDADALQKTCGGEVRTATQLCRRELALFQEALATGAPITVGCTQEAPLFSEVAAEAGRDAGTRYVNIRETAGWSDQASDAAPKMAALIAAAAEPAPSVSLVSMKSDGVALVYGRDETAIEAARRLADHLDITVLLTKPGDVAPPRPRRAERWYSGRPATARPRAATSSSMCRAGCRCFRPTTCAAGIFAPTPATPPRWRARCSRRPTSSASSTSRAT
jgi:hypothetical protein